MTSSTGKLLQPGILQWQIGEKKVTVINDGFFEANEAYFTNVPEGGLKTTLRDAFRPETPTLSTNIFLIESADHQPVLIDAGMGIKLAPAIVGRLTEGLAGLGIQPSDIGTVLLTHLHGDHYYGMVDSDGEKTFPNAKIWLSPEESDYWFANNVLNEQDLQNAKDAEATLRFYDRIETNGEELLPGIKAVPLPGHTPGQTGFMLTSAGEKLLFCADILTVPAIQATLPDVGFVTDADYSAAVQMRKQTLQQAADERMLLAGPHFEFPCLSYVKRQGKGFMLVPKQWF